jgi:large subunit ribosomal protein L25
MEAREDSGKQAAAQLRRDGKIPAIMYGGEAVRMLAVNSKELFKALSGENGKSVIVEIGLNDEPAHYTIVKEVQFHPITDQLFHADFMEIDMEKPFRARVPIVLDGEPVGVKIKGGNLRFHFREMNIESLPGEMPEAIHMDVSGMDINDKMVASDVQVAEGICKLDDPETRIVSIAPPKAGPGGTEEGEEGETPAGESAPEAGTK